MSPPRPDGTIELDQQRRFWNSWNAKHRTGDWRIPNVNARQAQMVRKWLTELGRTDLRILEVGCGSGWLCEQLVEFGTVTGTDLANEVLPLSGASPSGVSYVAGDFFKLDFPASGFDVVVTLEVLAHVEDQPAYIAKISDLLRPGGHLMLATQNQFALERWSGVAQQAPGQIRKWVNARELRRLLNPRLEVCALTSTLPVGDQGILRLINSYRFNRALSLVLSQSRIESTKERFLLGHTLMVLARKPLRAGIA